MRRFPIALLLLILAFPSFGQPIYTNYVRVTTLQKPTCENADGIISFSNFDGSQIPPPTNLYSITENQDLGSGTFFQNIKAGRYAFSFQENGQDFIREFAIDNFPAILDSNFNYNLFFKNSVGDSCNLGVGLINLIDNDLAPFPWYQAYLNWVNGLQFTWSNGQTGTLVSGLSSGQIYWVTAKIIANNCKFYFPFTRFDTTQYSQNAAASVVRVNRDTLFFKIKNRNTLNIGTTNIIKPYCDLANGSIQVELLNGNVPPVTWEWNNGVNNPVNANIAGGYYWVTVKNGEGCSGFSDFYLGKKNAPGFELVLNLVSIDSCLKNSGKVEMMAIQGNATPPFQYKYNDLPWSPSNMAPNLPGGYNNFSVKDVNGCLAMNYLNIPSFSPFNINALVNPINCLGEPGSINVTVTGGQPPYQYHWFAYPDQNGPSFIAPQPGSYQLLLTDTNQCKAKKYYYVDLPANCAQNVHLTPKVNLAANCLPNPSNPILNYQYFIHRMFNTDYFLAGTPDVYLSTLNQFGTIKAEPRPSFNPTCLSADWTIPGINPTLGQIQEIDVLLTPDSLFKNLGFSLYQSSSKPLRPGFDCDLYIDYFNHSTQITGTTHLDIILPPEVEFISSPYPYEVFAGNRYRFPISGLQIGEWNQITLVVKANVSVVVGTIFPFQIKMNPVPGEINLSDNDKTFPLQVVGSWDPNEISVSPSPYISPNEVDLIYHIDFQNLGNFRTEFVVLKDTLPESVDMSSLRFFHSSDPNFKMEVKDRVLTVRYPYLQLKPSSENEAASKGQFSFTIKRNPNLPIGYAIRNRASIYFDFNPPIQTAEATVTVFQFTGINPKISVFPNPATSYITLVGKPLSLFKIYDMFGREVQQGKSDFSGDISIKSLRNGVYILRMEGEAESFKFIVDGK